MGAASALPESLRPAAQRLLGDRLGLAERFVEMLATDGLERGLIGPREVDRLWERHVLNCALLLDGIDDGARTLADVGSGAGLPGVVLAIARPDLEITLIETMQRRATWLEEVSSALGLELEVVRARAEDLHGERTFDVVTARAVAALDKLAKWTLPLVAEGGELLALKGSSAAEEIERAQKTLRRLGGTDPRVVELGAGEVEVPTTVVRVRRAPQGERPRTARTRKGEGRG
jgi:16S rRNA (guanine527-N7)-methyltransferase